MNELKVPSGERIVQLTTGSPLRQLIKTAKKKNSVLVYVAVRKFIIKGQLAYLDEAPQDSRP